ncbi:MAG TPA: hypothetical protein VF166_00410 [Gemmatimonadaceae bacterium]
MRHDTLATRLFFATAVALALSACENHLPTAPPAIHYAPHPSIDDGSTPPTAPHSVHLIFPLPAGNPPYTTQI